MPRIQLYLTRWIWHPRAKSIQGERRARKPLWMNRWLKGRERTTWVRMFPISSLSVTIDQKVAFSAENATNIRKHKMWDSWRNSTRGTWIGSTWPSCKERYQEKNLSAGSIIYTWWQGKPRLRPRWMENIGADIFKMEISVNIWFKSWVNLDY